ncbi:hypothetical protein [Tunicatimonas pelagia]|uniref:hypothetical protein n=1 Tax=Tunicatimonas pelagia TaxID=931531 RepID=UPI00266574ED|nr:hypothetical protein [Tunicatimonas pelagia]WKN43573.1 hypothetical protein P0M28_01140 [Tunicatimonas pelagia]
MIRNTKSILVFLGMLLLAACDTTEVVNCPAFDFSIAETDWLLFPEERNYEFECQGEVMVFELLMFEASESYTFDYERELSLIPFPDYQKTDCNISFTTSHLSREYNINIFNTIAYRSPTERIDMGFGFNTLSLNLDIVGDTLIGNRIRYSSDDFEDYPIEHLPSFVLSDIEYSEVVRITNTLENVLPEQVYIAKNIGLVAFLKGDSTWVRR